MRFRRATLVPAWLFLALLTAGCDRGYHPHNIGRPAPQFAISDGVHSVDLRQLRGHVVLLNLWASWCAPCVEELPSLRALHDEMPGIDIVAVSIDQDDAAYRSFLARNHVNFLTIRDPSGRVNALYGTVQIPETYVIDGNGILRRKFVSAQEWTSPDIVKYLHKLSSEVRETPSATDKIEPMTQLDVMYRYEAAPSESAMVALGRVREVYGIRRVQMDEAAKTVRVEYDATRLTEPIVHQLLRRSGLDVVERVSLVLPQPV